MSQRRPPLRLITHTRHTYPTPLAPQTLVQRRGDGRIGIVQNYHPTALPARMGTFPVQWDDRRWEICGPADVTPLTTMSGEGS